MKKKLRVHIDAIFKAIGCNLSFEIFDCKNDVLPDWIGNVEIQSEFMICCENFTDKKQLQSFIGKQLHEYDNLIYWFDGCAICNKKNTTVSYYNALQASVVLQTLRQEAVLPKWLQTLVFDKYNATYAPDYKRYAKNMVLTESELWVYLGTYFPRSYAESFCIYDNLFSAVEIVKHLKKDNIEILDIGCGTGGNIVGLVTAIIKHNICSKVSITLIDGNAEAIAIANEILKHMSDRFNIEISIKTIECAISTISDLPTVNNQYDYILSFKMINELIAINQINAYYDFINYALPLLKEKGLLLLCDVTTKVGMEYNPILMNIQINNYIRDHQIFKTLIPISCREYENKCREKCFTQRCFNVPSRASTCPRTRGSA